MKNILVTGGAGFIGSNFIDFAIKQKPNLKIINLDALTYSGNLLNLAHLSDSEAYTFVRGNICDFELLRSLFKQYKVDTIVHFAAETHVDRSIVSPGEFMDTNVMGTYTLLEVSRQVWLEEWGGSDNFRFHHISTDEVYGSLGLEDPPFTETTPYSPRSPYAASKAASDHLVRSYFHTYQLPITITNCSNNYGPYQYPEKLVPLMILNAINGLSLPVYGDGQNIRDWLYVEDHCKAIWLVLEKGELGETYLVGGNSQPANIEVVEKICEILEQCLPSKGNVPYLSQIEFVGDRPGHDFRYDVNINKIYKELGWEPKYSFESGLEKTIKWYLDNSEWVASIQDKQIYKEWIGDNYEERGENK